MDNLLLVDIGGTNMRYAVANASNDNISEIEKSSFDPEKFDSFLEKLINKHDSDVLILSVAGPKINNVISMTNQEYTFDPIKIKEKFSINECFLLYDWEAIAYSYDYIKDSVEYIKKGEPFNQIDYLLVLELALALLCQLTIKLFYLPKLTIQLMHRLCFKKTSI